MSSMKKGDTVHIITCTMGGTFIVEGTARLIRYLGGGRWRVRFAKGDEAERFVDYAAQADPAGYVAQLNAQAQHRRYAHPLHPIPPPDDPMATTIRAAALANRTGIQVTEE